MKTSPAVANVSVSRPVRVFLWMIRCGAATFACWAAFRFLGDLSGLAAEFEATNPLMMALLSGIASTLILEAYKARRGKLPFLVFIGVVLLIAGALWSVVVFI